MNSVNLTEKELDAIDPKEFIVIKNARVNNLQNLSVALPRNKLLVITGLSGSGKSSLAFDTLFAEGQRMYVESLSSYARQFLGRMEKPEVDYIKGLSPAIAIEQKVNTRNPRSTIGTTTEIYDYLKLLFSRIGTTYSPISGKKVTKDTVTSVVDFIIRLGENEKVMIACPFNLKNGRSFEEELKVLLGKGYTRILLEGKPYFIDDLKETIDPSQTCHILIDRIVVSNDDDAVFRIADSVQTAFFESDGNCFVYHEGGTHKFSDRFECDGMKFEEPSVNFFSFNNPYGACKRCEGFGRILGIDPDLVIPNKSLSVYDGAIAPFRSEHMKKWINPLIQENGDTGFPIHRPYDQLTQEEQESLWTGHHGYKGIDGFFQFIESKLHKIQYRVMLSRYRGKTDCPDCKGSRLRKDASYVKISDMSIIDVVLMPVSVALNFFNTLQLPEGEKKISERLLKEITNRLEYLCEVGLEYLTLNRVTSTLSGGEYQRIKLATSLGSSLVGSMYVLDEPSIGLHPRDTHRLITVLKKLQSEGNTVIVVEHDEEVIRAADQIIDVGPDAGIHGGKLIFQGTFNELKDYPHSHTAQYLLGAAQVAAPDKRRPWQDAITFKGARENNLRSIDVKIPLGVLTVITGISGSGKSTLVEKIIFPGLSRQLDVVSPPAGKFDHIAGDYKQISQVEFVNQNPIGKSSRSNPVTYVKAYDAIRQLYADLPLSRQRGYKPSHFSFNVQGGRCEECQGEGVVKVEMQFMADIYLTCENCKGKRFGSEILDVEYKEKNIADVLNLTVEGALTFFDGKTQIINRLRPLFDVGLGYIKLGQSSNTLSGGEAQRVKLASFLIQNNTKSGEHVFFIFDEPTTGLHFHDINKLMTAINALIDKGHSVLIIEHNLEVIKSADWIIDLGPEGGDKGGQICFEGLPEDLVKLGESNHTGRYLAGKV